MNELDSFVSRISKFTELSKVEQIDWFAYFLKEKNNQSEFISNDIKKCFELLNIPSYSNIPAYLSNASKSGRQQKYIKTKQGYSLTRSYIDIFNEKVSKKVIPPPSDKLFPKEILCDCRTYIVDIASQAISCFDFGFYDACSVMLRKLIEVLIIETFERYGISDKIKNENNDFYFLSDLITKLLSDSKWNIGRNAKDGFSKIKRIGDMSAHNRRYFSKEPDVLELRESMRVCIQELIILIDYPKWNEELKRK